MRRIAPAAEEARLRRGLAAGGAGRERSPAAGEAELAGLARRIERAEAEQLARTGWPGRAAARALAGGLLVFKGLGSPFGAAFGMGLDGPVGPEVVDAVEAHLGGGPVRIELAAPAHPSLAAELGRRRYRVERFLLAWHRPVLPGDAGADLGAEVRPILEGEEAAWAEVFTRAFFGRPPGPAASAASILAMTSAQGNTCFAAFQGGAMVGVAVASAHGGVAMLSGAGVLPDHRGRGLQLALVKARLAWAAERDLDLAAATTAPGTASQRTLEKAGFRCAYPKVVLMREVARD